MSSERRRRRTQARRDLQDASSAPFRQLRNPWPPLNVASPEQVEDLHEASMRIVENTGIEFLNSEALELWEQAGADVQRNADGKRGRVRMDRALLLETVAQAPSSFTLHARNPECNVHIGDNAIVFATASGPAYSTNLERGPPPRHAGRLRGTDPPVAHLQYPARSALGPGGADRSAGLDAPPRLHLRPAQELRPCRDVPVPGAGRRP